MKRRRGEIWSMQQSKRGLFPGQLFSFGLYFWTKGYGKPPDVFWCMATGITGLGLSIMGVEVDAWFSALVP
jgi:hypothetical protein